MRTMRLDYCFMTSDMVNLISSWPNSLPKSSGKFWKSRQHNSALAQNHKKIPRNPLAGNFPIAQCLFWFELITGGFLDFVSMYCIQHCFICRPSDFSVSEDAGIESRTVATSSWAFGSQTL
jgi:hypothetical protein